MFLQFSDGRETKTYEIGHLEPSQEATLKEALAYMDMMEKRKIFGFYDFFGLLLMYLGVLAWFYLIYILIRTVSKRIRERRQKKDTTSTATSTTDNNILPTQNTDHNIEMPPMPEPSHNPAAAKSSSSQTLVDFETGSNEDLGVAGKVKEHGFKNQRLFSGGSGTVVHFKEPELDNGGNGEGSSGGEGWRRMVNI